MCPGPMSASNNDRSLVTDAQKRETLRTQGKLFTGKTQKKTNKNLKEK